MSYLFSLLVVAAILHGEVFAAFNANAADFRQSAIGSQKKKILSGKLVSYRYRRQIQNTNPSFDSMLYVRRVPENEDPGYVVTTITATDNDDGENGRLTYSMTAQSDARSGAMFDINPDTGLIVTTMALDRETIESHTFRLTATDQGTPPKYATTNLTIYVDDRNDHTPIFEQPIPVNITSQVTDTRSDAPVFQNSTYIVFVSESVPIGHVVVRVSASDSDAGSNAEISYSMDDVPEFEINEHSGEVYTRLQLDRETVSHYVFTVTASDHGTTSIHQQSMAIVQISIEDINDNPPIFPTSHYEGEIEENCPLYSSLLTITALDADAGSNGEVSYTFEGGSDADGRFVIDEMSGTVRVASLLDRESGAEYDLVAYAYDQGIPSLRTAVQITVEILDVNDNPPSFTRKEYFFTVNENNNPGEWVGEVTALDPDSLDNYHIRYTILDEDLFPFEVHYASGMITTLEMLDYESRTEYEFVIRAINVPYFADVIVHVDVIDYNDNMPILYDFEIFLNSYEGIFYEGDIGKVPATDPDISDELWYAIIRGNDYYHLILNESTGGIRLNPYLRRRLQPQTIEFIVQASDGLNVVAALGKFHIFIVTADMLANSVTVRMEGIQSSEFLSSKLVHFTETMERIIPTHRDFIHVFGVETEGPRLLSITFAAQRPDGTFFTSQHLQERIYVERSQLSSALGATVLPFSDDLCLHEICSGFHQCVATVSSWTPGEVIATASVIFHSVHPEIHYSCVCPLGYTGNYCLKEVNYCYSSPCINGGVCVQKEQGYSCLCQDGFTGTNCETENYLGGEFDWICHDLDLYDGPYCQMRTRSFMQDSLMMFPSLTQRVRFQLSVSFATHKPSGVIFYNGRYNQQHDFIALEIIDDQVQFSFSTGSDVTTVTASRVGGVSDGQWHTVLIEYYLMTATIILDDCDPAIALAYDGDHHDYRCAASATGSGDYRLLDLTGPFFLGNLPDISNSSRAQGEDLDFVGCIRDVYIDNEILDLATNVEDVGTQPGCPHKADFCESDPCHVGATCESGWDRYTCHCSSQSGGVNCQETMLDPVRVHSDGYMTFDTNETITLPWTNHIAFRTRDPSGVLMFLELTNDANIRIELVDGYIHYVTSSVSVQLDQRPVNDGEWHDFLAEWENNSVVLSVDFGLDMKSAQAMDSLDGERVISVMLGGMLVEGTLTSGFAGCLKGMSIGGSPLDPAVGARTNVEDGCNAPDSCLEADCPTHSQCVDLWDLHECQCDKGLFGPECLSACELDVCQHGSTCDLSPETDLGYNCTCSERFYGNHCEHTVEECPDDWWGYPVCGPCECDEEMGFDPACDKTTGECHCQEHFYRPSDSDTCYPCDCYEVGSSSQDCDLQTGQCSCRRGVSGRQCDACDDPHAEVTTSGCEVIHGFCPKHFDEGLWWPRTQWGGTATLDCPRGSYGTATRSCDFEKRWQMPNLLNCTLEYMYMYK
ncbi:cadherin EGF LAG seven-pass G-type receptor 2-like [Diadema setosum]|uniref:cadherin EGF LAG seven-pass G-type receptor 2-like n=1 Tax=Diadema setosum TaxID=31175 RepID=UPI003B3BE6A5